MILTHTTTKENKISILRNGFKIKNNSNHFKPNGVWLSIDGAWEEWCETNEFNTHCTETIKVSLQNLDKYLVIDSLDDFKKYYEEYCKENELSIDKCWNISLSRPFFDWIEKQKWHGVILTSKGEADTRMETFMYGWDCASVCVFDTKDIIIEDFLMPNGEMKNREDIKIMLDGE